MNSEVSKIKIKSDSEVLNVYYISTPKFKTIVTGVIFTSPLKQKFLAERALLALMLPKTNQRYPNEQALLTYLKDLYDMSLTGYVSKRGKTTSITFLTNIINSEFLKDKTDLFSNAITLLNDTINNPYLVDSNFDEKIITKEKKLLVDDLKRVYNNKVLYANLKLIEHMFKDELYRLNVNGAIEAVEAITKESLKAAYYEMLKSEASIFVIGDVNELKIKKAFKGNFSLSSSQPQDELTYLDLETKEIKEVIEVSESQKINQSTLCLGYRVDIRYGDALYYPMIVFNGMFGRFFHSKLYQTIREEHSLAYYINSDYASRKGIVVITSGINAEDYLKVVSLISEVLSKFEAGELSDENFDLTKKALINSILEGNDSQIGLLQDILMEIENPSRRMKTADKIASIKAVTKEQVIECSKKMKLDTIFFLKGTMEGVENDEEAI